MNSLKNSNIILKSKYCMEKYTKFKTSENQDLNDFLLETLA